MVPFGTPEEDSDSQEKDKAILAERDKGFVLAPDATVLGTTVKRASSLVNREQKPIEPTIVSKEPISNPG